MIVFPNAKINLGLHILSKREDGYHNIETLMCPVGTCDILEFLPASGETRLKLTGIPIEGDMRENLVYRAYMLLKEQYHLPNIIIHLHKIIPSFAGLGGGSSDAAFMLKGLNRLFNLKINTKELNLLAASLGSDCAFFIENVPAIATGRGEILEPAKDYLQNYKLYMFFPGLGVSTAEAYKGIEPIADRTPIASILETSITVWKDTLVNDFEKSVFQKYPELKELKSQIYKSGAIYASMSGSGAALYGIFEKNYTLPSEMRKMVI